MTDNLPVSQQSENPLYTPSVQVSNQQDPEIASLLKLILQRLKEIDIDRDVVKTSGAHKYLQMRRDALMQLVKAGEIGHFDKYGSAYRFSKTRHLLPWLIHKLEKLPDWQKKGGVV